MVQAAAHACEGEPRASWCVKGLTGFEKEAQVYSVSLGSQGLLSSLFAIVRWLKLAAKCCQVIKELEYRVSGEPIDQEALKLTADDGSNLLGSTVFQFREKLRLPEGQNTLDFGHLAMSSSATAAASAIAGLQRL